MNNSICLPLFQDFDGFSPIIERIREHRDEFAKESASTQAEMARVGFRLKENLRRLFKLPASEKAELLAEKAREATRDHKKATEVLSQWEAVETSVKKLSETDVNSPEFPRQLTAFLNAVNRTSGQKSWYVYGENSALSKLSPDLNRFLTLVTQNPIDFETLKKNWPGLTQNEQAGIAGLLGLPDNQIRPTPYRTEDIHELLLAAHSLPLELQMGGGLQIFRGLQSATETFRRLEVLKHLSNLMNGDIPIPEWRRAIANPPDTITLLKRVRGKQRLVDGEIERGDLGSYIAGQSYVAQAVEGHPLGALEVKFADAYLKEAKQTKKLSTTPNNLVPSQQSYISALGHYLENNDRIAAKTLNEWIRFLNNEPITLSKRSLSGRDLGLMASLVEGSAHMPMGTNDWHRVGYLSQKKSLTHEDTEFLEGLLTKIEGGKGYESLSIHVRGLLKTGKISGKTVREEQDRLRKERLLKSTGRARNKPEAPEADHSKTEYALSEARREFEDDSTLNSLENTRLRNLDRYHRDRLLGRASQAGLNITPEEKARGQSAFQKTAELKRSQPLNPESLETIANLKVSLSHYGERPIDTEIIEDLFRF